ncbi:MAG: putative bifunctional diguanylate cyclase/phosphodiesterase [Pseudonocardiaceae bacterium]
MNATAYVRMSQQETYDFLGELTDRLVAALSDSTVDTESASEVGARLVSADFTGERSLTRTVEVLARRLPVITAEPPSAIRLIELLSALVSGYTWALRDRIFDQQEDVKLALLHARQGMERDLRASEARFREVFNSSPVGIIISEPGGPIVQTNPSLDERLGYADGELHGVDLNDLFAPDDAEATAPAQQSYQELLSGIESRLRVQCRLRHKDGEFAWVSLAVSVLRDAEQRPEYFATMVDDITEHHLLKEWLRHQTLHDVQTGLPNRQYLVSHLERVLGLLEPSAVVTLLHLDLDGFSAINDGLGQRFGDQMLEVVAQRLRKVVAEYRAMVARIGPDEYAVLIEPADSPPNVTALAEAINNELAEPVYLNGIGVAATATIGAVQRQAAGMEPAELLRAAGSTLRRLRGKGKRQWALFDADADAAERADLPLAAALPGALESGELQVAYQPVVTLDDGRLVGVEAVLNWPHAQHGVLSHERCIQVAERTGVVYALGEWVLQVAARQAACWQRERTGQVPPVVVNLTMSQAQDPDLVAKVRATLDETGLGPAGLELRMPVAAIRGTSGLPVGEGGEEAEDNLRVLAELGVRAGLHDFGGGIGALRCLADLPVNVVRVAEPVSQQVADDPSRILSQSVHSLVHIVRAAGINVIAYPVDSNEQAACWRWVGANWAVGAACGSPGAPETVAELLDA